MKFFGHLKTVLRHKYEVFKLSIKLGIPFRGFFHDMSKFSYIEFSEGVKYYVDGKYSPIINCKKDNGYSEAWLHHFGRNKHHFEYWHDPSAPEPTPIIPFVYMLEMICDRVAASKTYNGKDYKDSDSLEYFSKHESKYTLNPKLKAFLRDVFEQLTNKGEIVLNKKNVYKLYLKHTKKES